jgi:hypothetical protein
MSKLKMSTNKSAIRTILREALATTPPITDRGRDDKQFKSTVPKRLPIEPSDQVALQLSTQRPPVEDPEFVPSNPEELGRALESLAMLVPDDRVEEFYRMFVSLIDKINEEVDEVEAGG